MTRENNKIYEVKLKVPFYDLDPLQLVWHGNYFKYFDVAREGLFDNLGVDLHDFYNRTQILFPVIKTHIKYISPLRNRDEFICRVSILEASVKIALGFEIRLASNGKVCTRGGSEQAAVKSPEMEMMMRIPEEIRKGLGF